MAGKALSSFGDSALYLSLAIWAKDLTGSNSAAGLVFLALGAATLLAPFGGYLVDWVTHRRRLLMSTDAVTAAVVLTLVFVHSRDQLWLMYTVAFIYGLSSTVTGPGVTALLKDMLSEDDLVSSNAIRQVLGQGLRVLSPVVGAALYAAAGGSALAIFDAATFLGSIAALATVRVVESRREDVPDLPLLHRMRAGFVHIHHQPMLRRICVASGVAMLTIGFMESVSFAVVAAIGHPPSFFGTLMSVQAGGSIAGGVLVSRMLRRLGEARVVAAGLTFFAVAALGMIPRSLTVVLVAAVIMGVGVTFFAVGFGTALQRLTPPRLQGRVGAASYALTDVPQTVSIGVGAALVKVLDYRLMLSTLVAVSLGCALSVARSSRPMGAIASNEQKGVPHG